jgi:hypothetical protein
MLPFWNNATFAVRVTPVIKRAEKGNSDASKNIDLTI